MLEQQVKFPQCEISDFWNPNAPNFSGIALKRYTNVHSKYKDPIQSMNFYESLPASTNWDWYHWRSGANLRRNLPNPRLVSRVIHVDENVDSDATHFTTQFGQFVDHDITLTPVEDKEVDCCDNANAGDDRCLPIDVSTDDFFSSEDVTCLNFVRSVQHCEENGGRRNQVNGITAFLDGSQIYGSDLETAQKIRTFSNGELSVTIKDSGNLLPKINETFTAGEERAREIPGLTLSHTLWVREHNRVAKLVAKTYKRDGTDEEIYQHARRIVVAEYQNIVYGQYLSEILGTDDLKPTSGGSKYKKTTNPAMTNEFATAAYR